MVRPLDQERMEALDKEMASTEMVTTTATAMATEVERNAISTTGP
jgi:hypothetical protein